ncbi:tRNA epoxyqueuosine(34) reductase QueG [Brucellaceae bacterium C25G]
MVTLTSDDKETAKKLKLKNLLADEARAAGFDVVAFTHPGSIPQAPERLREFIDNGYHADMDWMEETEERRAHPQTLWSDVRTIVMLGMNYGPEHDPMEVLKHSDRGAISVYAQNRDYHDIIKGKLKHVASRFIARASGAVKVFVDTAPVMEKPLAAAAGMGWQGKHTNLVSRQYGSWLFLGSIFITLELPPDEPERNSCGSCRACLDACPTSAFPTPFKIDARRCISYLTIENKGAIPHEFRKKIGNHIYGCDDCLSACPWNKFAVTAQEIKLRAREDLRSPSLEFLLGLDDTQFRTFFSGSPIKRIGRNRFLRNVIIAAGNSGNDEFIPQLKQHLDDPEPLVRGTAVWALRQLLPQDNINPLQQLYAKDETDPDVLDEWNR